jgi:hypothetical protein
MSRQKSLENVYKDVLKFAGIETDIVVSDKDELIDTSEPILVMSKPKSAPDNYKLCSIWGLLEVPEINAVLKNEIPFENKIPKAIFRGSTTGPSEYYSNPSLRKFSRLQLITLAKNNEQFLNAKITNLVQYPKKYPEKFINLLGPGPLEDLKKNNMTKMEQQKYKYIIVADGNVATYGFFWVLASGSVPIKQESEHIQYFETGDNDIVVPGVHYIPVKRDFSDLIEKIQWLINNENEARKIAENARNFALKHFNYESMKKQLKEVVLKEN